VRLEKHSWLEVASNICNKQRGIQTYNVSDVNPASFVLQSAYGAPITNGSAYARILSTANQVAMNNPGPVDSYPPGWGGNSSIPGEETFVDNDITNGMAFQTHYQVRCFSPRVADIRSFLCFSRNSLLRINLIQQRTNLIHNVVRLISQTEPTGKKEESAIVGSEFEPIWQG
jgi:hypothetical protein